MGRQDITRATESRQVTVSGTCPRGHTITATVTGQARLGEVAHAMATGVCPHGCGTATMTGSA